MGATCEIVRACAEKVHSIFVYVGFGVSNVPQIAAGSSGFGTPEEDIVPGKYLQCVPGICRSF